MKQNSVDVIIMSLNLIDTSSSLKRKYVDIVVLTS
jgi:hypothetical protein